MMRVETALASVLAAATMIALVGCTLAPPPTAPPRATSVPTLLPTPAVAPMATPEPTLTSVPEATLTPTQASPATAPPTPSPAANIGPTRTPRPTIPPFPTLTPIRAPTTTPPTATPLPTLSPEAVAATEALVPEWVRNRSDLVSFLLSLKRTLPNASALLEGLPWVQDGIGNPASGVVSWEVTFVFGLSDYWRLGPTGQELLFSILNKPWMHGEISYEEVRVLGNLLKVLRKDPYVTHRLLQMPFLDSVDGNHEYQMISMIESYLFSDSSVLDGLLSSPVFDGTLTDDHAPELLLIRHEQLLSEAVAAIRALPWVQDGTNLSEWEEVSGLIDLALKSDVFFRAAMDSLGVQDGFSLDELTSLKSLIYARRQLVGQYITEVAAIERLPWLLDGVNRTEWDGALALLQLAREDITTFRSTIDSDWVQDGVTEDEIRMISSLA